MDDLDEAIAVDTTVLIRQGRRCCKLANGHFPRAHKLEQPAARPVAWTLAILFITRFLCLYFHRLLLLNVLTQWNVYAALHHYKQDIPNTQATHGHYHPSTATRSLSRGWTLHQSAHLNVHATPNVQQAKGERRETKRTAVKRQLQALLVSTSTRHLIVMGSFLPRQCTMRIIAKGYNCSFSLPPSLTWLLAGCFCCSLLCPCGITLSPEPNSRGVVSKLYF